MRINKKISAAITTTMLLALNVSSAPPTTAGIFRPNCTENNRGIGDVSGESSRNTVRLSWNSPGYFFQSIHVCYKKNWALVGKCDGGSYQYETYGSPVSYGTITISNLDSNSCYKFAVYGIDAGDRLIGEKKIKTTK